MIKIYVTESDDCEHKNFIHLESNLRTFKLDDDKLKRQLVSTNTTYYKRCSDCGEAFDVQVITSKTNEN